MSRELDELVDELLRRREEAVSLVRRLYAGELSAEAFIAAMREWSNAQAELVARIKSGASRLPSYERYRLLSRALLGAKTFPLGEALRRDAGRLGLAPDEAWWCGLVLQERFSSAGEPPARAPEDQAPKIIIEPVSTTPPVELVQCTGGLRRRTRGDYGRARGGSGDVPHRRRLLCSGLDLFRLFSHRLRLGRGYEGGRLPHPLRQVLGVDGGGRVGGGRSQRTRWGEGGRPQERQALRVA